MDLQGKVALVSGAAHGIGRATAELFLSQGAAVVLADIEEAAVAEAAGALGPRASFVALDVTSENSWRAAVESTLSTHGGLTTLINNAGVTGRKRLTALTEHEYRSVVDVDQIGVFLGMQQSAAALSESGNASIVNISSVAGLRSRPGSFSYTAAKWAVRGMSQAAAVELGSLGIRVNCVLPGATRTGMMTDFSNGDFDFIPLRRMCDRSEIASVIAFLASDASSFMSGAELVVDGGHTAMLGGVAPSD